jgi:decaprenylphospho-beta-D-ribofuranose 2-oxidase
VLNISKTEIPFVSFDGGVHALGSLERPDRYRYWDQKLVTTPRISRGAGLSYAPCSFLDQGTSISHESFDRILGFDPIENIIEVEAGISLHALFCFLLKRGLYLPVQPGHGRITLGGCIAADVHGKNHILDGTFISQVESITLFHPSHGLMELSRTKEPDLFKLTCGGYGLTGNIVQARIRAKTLPSSAINLTPIPFLNSADGLNQLFTEAASSDFSYTWHDFNRRDSRFGEGYLFKANFSEEGQNFTSQVEVLDPPELTSAGRATLPICAMNKYSIGLLNKLFCLQQSYGSESKSLSIQKALFPIHKTQFYFTLFGKKGFYEYQAILPRNKICEYLDDIKLKVKNDAIVVSLASAKAFCGEQELIRFTGDGICFAINFARNEKTYKFMQFLDKRIIDLGGIPNIIKDSRLPRNVFDSCYPQADKFRSLLNTFDSKRLFRSELSMRLGL